jgi:hypothetical protein
MVKLIQASFAGGEVSPEVASRIDLAKRATAVERAENFFSRVEGALESRPGQLFVARAKSNGVRLLPFEFNVDQTFIIELSDQAARFHSDGGQIVEAAVTITGATSTTITAAGHGYADGDEIYLTGIGGITNLNGRNVKVDNATTNTFTVTDLDDNAITIAGTYTSGGSAQRVYEIATPYASADLFDLNYAQSGDVLTICHPDYAPRELVRLSNTNWTLTEVTFTPDQAPPTALSGQNNVVEAHERAVLVSEFPVRVETKHGFATGTKVRFTDATTSFGSFLESQGEMRLTALNAEEFILEGIDGTGQSNTTDGGVFRVTGDPIKYKVTALGARSGSESVAALSSSSLTITNVAQADPAVVTTSSAHGLQYGDEFEIASVGGMTELNGRRFLVLSAPTTTTIELMSLGREVIDSTGYTAYTSGGTATPAFISVERVAQKFEVELSWTAAPDASAYNIYRQTAGGYVYIGTSSTDSFVDDFLADDSIETISTPFNPFEEGAGYQPSVTSFFNQRQIYANSDAFPNRFWTTQTGSFYTFSVASPVRDDDSIIGTIAARRINEIRHLVPLSDLVILTSGAEYRIFGDGSAPFTPSTINIKPQSFFGSTSLTPIVAGSLALYVTPGQAVREIGYEFAADRFVGNDITILSRHLFDDHVLVDWAYAPAPYSLVWAVRDDGIALSLTYQQEQEVYAWTRHTTRGKYKSVAVVREGERDVPYFAVERVIGGVTQTFVERLEDRYCATACDAFAVDAGLALNSPITITGATAADPVVITAPGHGLSNGDTVDIRQVYEVTDENTQREQLSADYNGAGYTIANVTTDTFELQNNGADVDGSGFAAYSSGGTVRKAVTAVSGLWHLEGETVVAAANGYAYADLTVTNGTVTLPAAASQISVGLPYRCQLISLPISTYVGDESVVGAAKNISSVTVRVLRSLGMWTGPSTDQMREAKFGLPSAWGQPMPLRSDDITVTLKGDWNSKRQVVVEQRAPLPLTIIGLSPDVRVGR